MSRSIPADVIFHRSGSKYRADPPAHKAHPNTKATVCFRNLTGRPVWIWFPQDFLVGSPALIADEDRCFDFNLAAAAGSYPYSAYVVGPNEFVEGNSPPEIIIDK